jgi:hypothetical protein
MEDRQRALLAAAPCRLAAAGAAMQGPGAWQWDRLLYSLSPYPANRARSFGAS